LRPDLSDPIATAIPSLPVTSPAPRTNADVPFNSDNGVWLKNYHLSLIEPSGASEQARRQGSAEEDW